MEAVIFIGIQGSGKSTFYRERFFDTHVHISLDLLKTRQRERAVLHSCFANGRRFVIDNTNVRAAERAIYINAAKSAGFRVRGYFFDTPLRDALLRNAQRAGTGKIPAAGVAGTFKRLERPTPAEGFDELYVVSKDESGRAVATPWADLERAPIAEAPARHRIFLLSPAYAGGVRGKLLLRTNANFDLAVRLRRDGIPLGEAFAFISDLYFRGKLAYAQAFAAPPEEIPGTFVITPGHGLVPPETVITVEQFRYMTSVPVDAAEARYRVPLERSCRTLDELAGADCDFVLLGSVATLKYLEPIVGVYGDRLLFPEEFTGRGDMSRGGLMLRCARAGVQLTYVPLGKATRHGPRPPKLPKIRRNTGAP